MLEKIFTSKSRTEFLQEFIFNPETEYHTRELAKKTKFSPMQVSKELKNLESVGIIKRKERGNMIIYQLNDKCPFLPDLRNLFIKTDYLANFLKQKLKNKTKISFIFGSFAKGNFNEESDIDLFIISEIKEEQLIKIIKALEKRVNKEINYVLWSEREFLDKNKKGNHLLKTIKKENIIMIEGDENDFKQQIK